MLGNHLRFKIPSQMEDVVCEVKFLVVMVEAWVNAIVKLTI
jgi:hypothetical protein